MNADHFRTTYKTIGGMGIVQTPIGTMELVADTSGCRSPSRAIRRLKKHPLPQKAEYTCLCVGDRIYMHPTAYEEMLLQLARKFDKTMMEAFFHDR